MKINALYIFLIFIFMISENSFSQFSFLSEPYNELDIKFLKGKIEASPEESFFNMVSIKNNASQPLSFQLNFSIPQGWNLFNDPLQNLTLNPSDSVIIPLRASINKDVKGEIGYVVVASIADKKGKVIKAGYSYVNVPKKTGLIFRPVKRSDYIDQNTRKSSISFSFNNMGNVDEQVFLSLKLDNDLLMEGATENYYYSDVYLPARRDTVLEFEINLSEKADINKVVRRVTMEASTKDTAFRSTFWLKSIKNSFTNVINSDEKMLVVDLLASNLFGDGSPSYTTSFFGKVKFKNSTNLFYKVQNLDLVKWEQNDKQSLYNIGYSFWRNDITFGDITNSIENSMAGRGIEVNMRYKGSDFMGIVSKDKFINAFKYGAIANYRIVEPLKITAGYSVNDNMEYGYKSTIYLGGFSAKIFNQSITVVPGFSQTNYDNGLERTSMAYKLGYGSNIGKMKFYASSRISGKDYAGIMGGRSESDASLDYPITKSSALSGRYSISDFKRRVYNADSSQKENFTNNQFGELRYTQIVSPLLSYFIGPYYDYQAANSFALFSNNDYFSSYSAKLLAGIKVTNSNKTILFSPSMRVGFGWVGNYTNFIYGQYYPEFKKGKPYPTGMFAINLKAYNFNLYGGYFFGPISLNQSLNYFYFAKEPKSLRIMPGFETFIYGDIIQYVGRLSYVNNIDSKTTRYNLINEITAYLKYGFTFKFLHTYALQSTSDIATDKREQFSSNYFELSLRKEFGFDQPRLKFHNLTVIFFKDYNGNNVQDLNEPGVKDVLLEIARDEDFDKDKQEYVYSGEYMSTELFSDHLGKTSYYNIPEGAYFIRPTAMGKMEGNFSYDRSEQQIIVDKNKTIFIPFFENNKIFGSIIMNRSKLSNLGKLDLSNIKITATDVKGLEISTLTDAQGKFVLYVPTVDKYTVRINNIFYENFDLQQNDFEVQLNGYKQFEVTFIFNEKSRRINFSSSMDYEQTLGQQDVRIMRRTTMQGTVKDAASLKPLKAKISIIDNSTGQAIASTNAGLRSGEFNLSFLAGDNYVLMVTADEYWFYSENLYLNQLTTFQNFNREVLLKSIDIGSSIELNNVTFERNKATLAPEAMAELENLTKVLKNNPNVIVEIGGHCDDIEAAQNASIADERAKAVAAFLIEREIPNITSKAYSNSRPVASGDTEDGHKKNRRVEVTVLDK